MSEVSLSYEPSDEEALEILRGFVGPNCVPSPDSIEILQQADLVLLSGQFVGAGKSTFIRALEDEYRVNIPSFTNRDLRPGEVEGVDKCKKSLGQLATAAENGELLELEEVRPGIFYATPATLDTSKRYVKDLELKGALRLRAYAPELPIVVPVPPLDITDGLTEWEWRVILREGYRHSIKDEDIHDLKGRLEGAVEEVDRIAEKGLAEDPNTLIVVNDDLSVALYSMEEFLRTGKKLDQAQNHLSEGGLNGHLQAVRNLASNALAA